MFTIEHTMLEPGKNQIENTLVAAAEWELGKLKFEDRDFFRLEGVAASSKCFRKVKQKLCKGMTNYIL